jgi:phosphatidylinositol phospholipase C delta
MNAQLADHYFLFIGHNSYLTGNQLISSDSSVDPIIDALRRGVKLSNWIYGQTPGKDDVEVRHIWRVYVKL